MSAPTTVISTALAVVRAATCTRSYRRSSTSASSRRLNCSPTGSATRSVTPAPRPVCHAAAAEFYAAALESDEAAPARQYLAERNFDLDAARHFGCGFAPSGWESLT